MPEFHFSERDDQVFPELFQNKIHKVMQTCETGEVFCAYENKSEAACWEWIDSNAHLYPESTFHVENDHAGH